MRVYQAKKDKSTQNAKVHAPSCREPNGSRTITPSNALFTFCNLLYRSEELDLKPIFLLCWNLFFKGNQIFKFFLKINLPLKKRVQCLKKCLSHWVTLFKKKNVCHIESLCLGKNCLSHWVTVFKKKTVKTFENCEKMSKMWKTVINGPFLNVFDSFWPFLTVFS